jgi:hypothetical protein
VWTAAKCSTTDITADPAFVQSTGGPNMNLHLKAGSPAIGRGDASKFPSTDFDGQTRTSPPDAGADEYGTTTSVANLYVSISGNDSTCVRGDSSKPCKSFDKAYAIAQLGDIVQVAGGDYGDQVLTLKSDKSAGGNLADVVFQPAPGSTVTIGEFDSGTDTQSPNGAKHVTIKDMSDNNISSKYCTWGVTNGSEDITIINGDACNINVFDSNSITIDGGDWGPCVVGTVPSSYDDPCGNNKIVNSQNITITNTKIHDIVTADAPSHHIECMFIVSGSNITISKNKFYGCGIYDIFIQRYDGGQINNLLIENNWFGQPRDGEYPNFDGYSDRSLAFSPRSQAFSNVNIRNNSFHPGADISLDDDGWGGAYNNFKLTNNILRLDNWMCGNGVIFSHNLYTGTTGCGGAGSLVAAAGYINTANDSSLNYHLTPSSAGIDAGDSAGFPATDIDNQTRPQGSIVDIGADEYSSGGSSPKTSDLNGDGQVNITDLSILLTNYNSSNAAADLNNDGSVNIFDLSILLTSYGS